MCYYLIMSLSNKQLFIGYICYYLNPIYLLLSGLYLFKYKYYIIHGDKETTNEIIKKLLTHINSSIIKHSNGKDVPTGYFWSWKCIGHIENHNENDQITIITTPSFYKELIQLNEISFTNENDETPIKDFPSKIVVYIRKGGFKNFYYQSIKLDISHIQPIGDQELILNNMVNFYKSAGRATFFIHGVTCAGKSTLGYLLAKQLGGIYCHSFNPTEPGDRLSTLIVDIERDDQPIIIVLEEADIIIKDINAGVIKKNPEMPISVYNKTTWSTFLDDMIFYKNIILILTSNTSKEKIDSLDESYLRKGRVNESYSMLNKLVI